MNQKGFNLFTALVAIVLVVLAVLLSKTMVDSEQQIIQKISDIEEEQKMQAIADMAKADALHSFNFGIRFAIERHLTKDGEQGNESDQPNGVPDNRYLITPETLKLGWEEIKQDFARTYFGVCEVSREGEICQGRQIATKAANYLPALLERTPDVRGYTIDLQSPQAAELRELLQKVFDKSSAENDFFKVIDCDGTWAGCPNGSFYINMNLKEIENGGYLRDEEFERFPQIVVTNRQTGRVLKEPILPRGNVQIYIPLRLFKAISGGLEIAKSGGAGLFEEEFKNTVDSLKVGVCDSGCAPITNPIDSASFFEKFAEYACAGDQLSGSARNSLPLIQLLGFPGHSYDPNDSTKMNLDLKKFVEETQLNPKIDGLASEKLTGSDDFKIVKSSGENFAMHSDAIVLAKKSRTVIPLGQAGGQYFAFCSKVGRIEAIIVFEDSNEKYIVSNVEEGGANRYAVRLVDSSYSEFEPPMAGGGLLVCRTVAATGSSALGGALSCEEGEG